ncbi:MAG: 23S rRNA (guanosine(2251)-2'-O)-methyltransferase RlmB [Cytophagales bacterium]|nr:23S rRNA (guanosine(2251)-2'-O)-methyltransferase RlmB [Cytophagales bacterium]MDW8384276.1 23S rRNA (guanosine(2251)-2'-O)-methyltransferase RlmB [Flammeovirgaceae bacterium]
MSLIFGIKPIYEALRAGKEIDKILVQRDIRNPEIVQLLKMARTQNIPVAYVPVFKLEKITSKNHQGIVAYLAQISYAKLENVLPSVFESGQIPLLLLLDRITDVRNFGAIARSAECAGVHAIVLPEKGSAQINADAMKTSAGALHIVNVCREKSLLQVVKYLQNSGIQVVACSEKATELIYTANYTLPTAIIVGSEENGISPELLRSADCIRKIPMLGKITSLNVSVATGVILYEVVRQRILKK